MAPQPDRHLSLEDANRIRTYIVSMIKGELSRSYVKNTIKTLFNMDLDADLKNTEQMLRVIYDKENSFQEQKELSRKIDCLTNTTIYSICLKPTVADDRPVTCWFCGEKMYYAGDTRHEPEVKIAFEGYIENDRFNDEYFIKNKYVHSKCFVELVALMNITSSTKKQVGKKDKGPRMLRPEEVKT